MIPKDLTHSDFENAAKEIDRKGIPIQRASVHYDLVFNGNKYPPKYMISIAMKYSSGEEWTSDKFNAVEARDYFQNRGYQVIDRRKDNSEKQVIDEDDELEFPEGKERYRLHLSKERNGELVKTIKEKRLKETGELRCEVCNFSFREKYGERGLGFIEAHHTVPLAELIEERQTKLSELALVCSNCHRMLHRGHAVLNVDQLQKLVVK